MSSEELRECRERIDEIDLEIASLLSRRVKVAFEAGIAKKGGQVYDPAREGEVIERVAAAAEGVDRRAVEHIYREILSACRAVQRRPRVAFLGPEGSFSHEGALASFGSEMMPVYCTSFVDVFAEVEKGKADWGVVPAENSLEGTVLPTMDAFASLQGTELSIQRELSISIDHNLASGENRLEDILEVFSHPQALGQCREWLRANLPSAIQIPAASTSAAAALAVGSRGRAAVCSELAAGNNELNVLARKIQDRGRNTTRFWTVGFGNPGMGERNKTSILFNVSHTPGSLFRAMEPIYTNGLNLTHIQSRPLSGSPFEYYFFIDIEGHVEEPHVRNALDEMRERASFIRLLGSYPCF
ncbi:MAG: prephenate dehydratase [Synergistaceae bacterium]|nr:prephenate dehydratase [Synergistota bacterium]NLM70376.1 prephenate dehydratase [Synergistaceae bacterium]